MSDEWTTLTGTAVPSGRFNRAARLGGLGAGLMGAMIGGGAKALLSGQRPDPRSLVMTPGNISRLTNELAKMRGAAMKMGQLLSMESEDLLPPELAQVMSRLRDGAQMMPPKQLRAVLSTEYGPAFLKRFKRFDPRPVAAASIGQVHKAVALDGRVLALKVQYPGIREAIDADVANLGTLLRVSGILPKGLPLAPLLDEARRQLHEEADYHREARELAQAAARVGDGFAVPELAEDLCTGQILAMQFIDSQPIESLSGEDQQTRDAVMTRLFALTLREIFDWRSVQTDPNFANFRWQPETQEVVLLDYGAARGYDAAFAEDVREVMRLGLEGNGDAVLAQLQAMNIVPQDAPEGQMQVLARMIALAMEVFGAEQVDFGDTRFLEAMREAGMQLGLREDFRHLPPWDVLYLQRKLAGLVLLATRLKARVGMRALAQDHLTGPVA